jgi:hypothetical protein
MLTQFVAAFDDCFVYRYTQDNIPKEKIAVRYVMGPKQRVMYDIVNQAKNITLPVIALEQTNVRRDPARVQNKDNHFYRRHLNDKNISKVPQPIPVNIDISVSIIANYKEDVDQIITNFVPWCNPYFIISWKVPEEFGMDFDDEIRSEVSWSGEVSFENPVDIASTDKYRIVANTAFTIKGWIFPSLVTPVAPIYVVNSNFYAVGTGVDLYSYDSYPSLSGVDYSNTDVVLISAYPEITNEFINGVPFYTSLSVNSSVDNVFTFYGKRFNFENKWYLSSNKVIPGLTYEKVTTFKSSSISAYRLPDNIVTTVNDNIAAISLSSEWLSSGSFTFVTSNSAAWVTNNYNIVVI